MNTPSHFLMTAALRKALPKVPMVRSAVLIGSVAPDVPLYLLSFGGIAYFHFVEGWTVNRAARHIFDTLYFEDAGWIAAHSLLHSPVSLIFGLVAVRFIASRWKRFAAWMHWFLVSCLFHSAVDIVTHFDDGPVLFWPLNLSYRFQSPVSYWDSNHFGAQFAVFELSLAVVLTMYLVLPWLWRFVAARLQPQE